MGTSLHLDLAFTCCWFTALAKALSWFASAVVLATDFFVLLSFLSSLLVVCVFFCCLGAFVLPIHCISHFCHIVYRFHSYFYYLLLLLLLLLIRINFSSNLLFSFFFSYLCQRIDVILNLELCLVLSLASQALSIYVCWTFKSKWNCVEYSIFYYHEQLNVCLCHYCSDKLRPSHPVNLNIITVISFHYNLFANI